LNEVIELSDVPALVARYHAPLLRYAALYLDYAGAEDATQDTWERFWAVIRAGGTIRPEGAQALLYKILKRRLIDLARRMKYRLALPLEALEVEPLREGWEAEIAERETVEQALAQMTDFLRETLLLREAGYEFEEIALHMDVTPASVRVRLLRARRQAAGLLERMAS